MERPSFPKRSLPMTLEMKDFLRRRTWRIHPDHAMTRAEPLLDRQPATWTGHAVKMRLLEAYQVERKIPERRPNGGGSNWPSVIHEWTDVLHWQDARARVWDEWSNAKGAYPYEVSRMEEALSWLALLANHRDEQQALETWAKVAALNRSLTRELRKRKMSRSTLYRHVMTGAMRIASELNRRGVAVR